MATAEDAHNLLKAFSKNPETGVENAGIAISIELVRRLIEMSFLSIKVQTAKLPSSDLFGTTDGKKFYVSFDATPNSKGSTTTFDKIPSLGGIVTPVARTSPVEVITQAFISKDDIKIKKDAPRTKVGTIAITFSEIETAFQLNKLSIELLLLGNKQFGKVTNEWEEDPAAMKTLEDEFGFTRTDFADLDDVMKSIRLALPNRLAEAFVESIRWPDIFGLFPGIVFEGSGRLSAEGDYLLFSADSKLNFSQCPIAPVDGSITTESDSTSSDSGVFVSATGAASQYPYSSGGQQFGGGQIAEDLPILTTGDVFLYSPKTLFEVNFRGIAKPAVGFSNRGSSGVFHWGYSVTLMLEDFELSLSPKKPLEFLLEIKLTADGYGDASVKIGCITHRVLMVNFRGRVDPLNISFGIGFDFPRKEVVLYSKIEKAEARDFKFGVGAPWPLSVVAEVILENAAEKAITDQAGTILAASRIPLARWLPLEKIAKLQKGLSVHEDPARDSLTIGAALDL